MEISHLICTAYQVTGFYMKSNTRMKWVNCLKSVFEALPSGVKMGTDRLGTQQVLRTQLCYIAFGDIPPN